MKIRGKYLIVLLSVCGIIASGVGLLTNTAGLFFTPVAGDLWLERGTSALTLTVSNLAYATGGMFTTRIITEKSLRISAVLLTAVLSVSPVWMAAAQNALTL